MLKTFYLPYGRDRVPLTLDERRVTGCIEARLEGCGGARGEDLVAEALEKPIASPGLAELARGKRDVVIIISDHTRPVPSRAILPPMLRLIRQASPGARIRLLVATGCHRATTRGELADKLGEELLRSEEIVIHDCDDAANLVSLGTMPSGQALRINRVAAEADMLLAEGFIEPHFFAGFSGGRKSVLPGVASREAVVGNHCAEFIDSPCARTGILEGNPIHRDMLWAAERAGLRFIVNVVLDSGKRIVRAYAGDPVAAHAEGCDFVRQRCSASGAPSDIVVTTNGGYPLDQNVYQAVKGMTAAEPIVKPGGVIVMLARCNDGVGGDHFYHQIADCESIEAQLAAYRARARGETLPDQWQSQILFRVMQRARVILVSEMPADVVRRMRIFPAKDVADAMALAEELAGDPRASVAVIPDGVSVITSAK